MNNIGKTHVKDKAPLQSKDHILEEKEEKGRGENQDPLKGDPQMVTNRKVMPVSPP